MHTPQFPGQDPESWGESIWLWKRAIVAILALVTCVYPAQERMDNVLHSAIRIVQMGEELNTPTRGQEPKMPKHLQSLVEDSGLIHQGEHWTLAQLKTDNIEVFTMADGQVGWIKLVCHEINNGNQQPIKQPAHHLVFHKEQHACEEVARMLKDDVIKLESASP